MEGAGKGRHPGLLAPGPVTIALVVLLVVGCLLPGPTGAQTAPTSPASVPSRPSRVPPPDELQLQPEEAPAPERPAPLLRRYIPGLQESLEKLPPFIRYTDF